MRMLTGAIYQCAQRAHALVVFLPHAEIIYINTLFSLPRPKVVHWFFLAPIGVNEYYHFVI